MGFYIRYREMQEYYEQVKQWAESVQGILCDLYKRWERLEKEEKMQGSAADAIRVRIEEFHLPVIRGIQLILREFIQKIATYIQDYYDNIDASPDTVISEDALLEGIQSIRNRMAQIEDAHQEVEHVLHSVDSICEISKPDVEPLLERGNSLILQLQHLIESVYEMERTHQSDVDELMELADEIKNGIAEYDWQYVKGKAVCTVGSIKGSPRFRKIAEMYQREEKKIDGIKEKVKPKTIGQTVEGVEITESGMIAAIHLVGSGTVNDVLRGKIDWDEAKDGFGTQALDYMNEMAGYDLSCLWGGIE